MKIWKTITGKEIIYSIDYEDHMSFLCLHLYPFGVICGYSDRKVEAEKPGPQYYETSWLDLLVVTGTTKQTIKEIKERRMDAIKATEFLILNKSSSHGHGVDQISRT